MLLLATALAYAPVFDAGFLNYDDPWLIQHNPFFAPSTWRTPVAAFFDFSRETRLALGAEYLPLRDLLGWLESRAFERAAGPMHAVSLGLFALALLLLRDALRRTLGLGSLTELSVFLFALHPVHVESVAWLAGQKDVLALVFISAALAAHARAARCARVIVPLLVLAACLAKAMSVSVIVLLAAQDYVLGRRPDRHLYAATAGLLALSMVLHVYVGSVVGMIAEPAGGSRASALITMGPVWLRYLGNCLFPLWLSVTYYVPDATNWSAPAVAGYAFVLGSVVMSVLRARHGDRLWWFACLWFFAPLVPVSQVVTPLQNRMADRYAWLSVLGPSVLVAGAFAYAFGHATRKVVRATLFGLALCALSVLAVLTFERSVLFTDSVLLFADAAAKARGDPRPVYHLARSLDESGRQDEAMAAYRQVLHLSEQAIVTERRRAANGLAGLLAKRGELVEAEQVLTRVLPDFPGDPKLTGNLARVLRAMGRQAEASALERSLPPRASPAWSESSDSTW